MAECARRKGRWLPFRLLALKSGWSVDEKRFIRQSHCRSDTLIVVESRRWLLRALIRWLMSRSHDRCRSSHRKTHRTSVVVIVIELTRLGSIVVILPCVRCIQTEEIDVLFHLVAHHGCGCLLLGSRLSVSRLVRRPKLARVERGKRAR